MTCTRLRSLSPAIAAALTLTFFAYAPTHAQSIASVARPPAAQTGPPLLSMGALR